MINKKFFTFTGEELTNQVFNGKSFLPTKNGIYFVCHTDTVHKDLPTKDEIKDTYGILTCPDKGLGADDRCGCYITKVMMEKFPDCGYLLSHDEETGDVEFLKSCPDLVADGMVKPKIFISFDRKGVNEYVDYDHKSVAIETFLATEGIERKTGSRSTCKELSEKYEVPCVNFCFGGDKFHQLTEYVDMFLMDRLMTMYAKFVKFALATELDYIKPVKYVYKSPYAAYEYPAYKGYWNRFTEGYADCWGSPKKTEKGLKRGCGSNPKSLKNADKYICDCCGKTCKGTKAVTMHGKHFCHDECLEFYFADNRPANLLPNGTCNVDGMDCVKCANGCYRNHGTVPKGSPSVTYSYTETTDTAPAPIVETEPIAYMSDYLRCDDCLSYYKQDRLTKWGESYLCEDCLQKWATSHYNMTEQPELPVFEVMGAV